MKALVLCAGKGERMLPLTKDIPKPMIPIKGKPILQYITELCKKNGINEILINTSYKADKIKEYFGNGKKFGLNIKYSFEDELLGTSGALNNFRQEIEDDFFVIYGDNITNLNLKEMLDIHRKNDCFATIYLYKQRIFNNKTTPGQVIIDKNFKVLKIIENPDDKEKKYIESIPENQKFTNAGIYIFNKEILDYIPKGYSDFARDILPKVVEEKLVMGFTKDFYIREVGQMMRYNIAKEEIESGKVSIN